MTFVDNVFPYPVRSVEHAAIVANRYDAKRHGYRKRRRRPYLGPHAVDFRGPFDERTLVTIFCAGNIRRRQFGNLQRYTSVKVTGTGTSARQAHDRARIERVKCDYLISRTRQ